VILIDSNILIDILNRDPYWFDWSFAQLEQAASLGRVMINPIVVAEVAPRFGSLEDFLASMMAMVVGVEALDAQAAFIAGQAFQTYRRARPADMPKAIVADFLIGGHAQALGATILTRDPRFYRRYFPTVPLITPETDTE
jgi:predicted nucleic acid-binding protein